MKEAENILNEMGELGNILNGVSKEMPNTVPQQYFELLTESILNKIAVEVEIKTLTPLLSGLNKEMPYTVPADYFNKLTIENPAVLKGRIISISLWKKLAAVAVVAGILVGSFYVLKGETKTDFTAEIKKIKTEELAKNIDSVNIIVPSVNDNEDIEEIPDAKDALQLASDDDLQQYLNENNETQFDNEDTKI